MAHCLFFLPISFMALMPRGRVLNFWLDKFKWRMVCDGLLVAKEIEGILARDHFKQQNITEL
jgi:hypothetical protein